MRLIYNFFLIFLLPACLFAEQEFEFTNSANFIALESRKEKKILKVFNEITFKIQNIQLTTDKVFIVGGDNFENGQIWLYNIKRDKKRVVVEIEKKIEACQIDNDAAFQMKTSSGKIESLVIDSEKSLFWFSCNYNVIAMDFSGAILYQHSLFKNPVTEIILLAQQRILITDQSYKLMIIDYTGQVFHSVQINERISKPFLLTSGQEIIFSGLSSAKVYRFDFKNEKIKLFDYLIDPNIKVTIKEYFFVNDKNQLVCLDTHLTVRLYSLENNIILKQSPVIENLAGVSRINSYQIDKESSWLRLQWLKEGRILQQEIPLEIPANDLAILLGGRDKIITHSRYGNIFYIISGAKIMKYDIQTKNLRSLSLPGVEKFSVRNYKKIKIFMNYLCALKNNLLQIYDLNKLVLLKEIPQTALAIDLDFNLENFSLYILQLSNKRFYVQIENLISTKETEIVRLPINDYYYRISASGNHNENGLAAVLHGHKKLLTLSQQNTISEVLLRDFAKYKVPYFEDRQVIYSFEQDKIRVFNQNMILQRSYKHPVEKIKNIFIINIKKEFFIFYQGTDLKIRIFKFNQRSRILQFHTEIVTISTIESIEQVDGTIFLWGKNLLQRSDTFLK